MRAPGLDRARALRQLRGPRELVLFACVSAFACAVPLLMRLPLPRVRALIARSPGRRATVAPERLARLVELAPQVSHPLVRTGCLPRGVTLFWFLRRAGFDVELRFGLDPAGADGHCWLALDGEPYLERVEVSRFTELYRLP